MWGVSCLFLKSKEEKRKNIFLFDKRKKKEPGGLGGSEPLSEQATYLIDPTLDPRAPDTPQRSPELGGFLEPAQN